MEDNSDIHLVFGDVAFARDNLAVVFASAEDNSDNHQVFVVFVSLVQDCFELAEDNLAFVVSRSLVFVAFDSNYRLLFRCLARNTRDDRCRLDVRKRNPWIPKIPYLRRTRIQIL